MARRLQVDWTQPVNPDAPLNSGLVSWWLAGESPYWGGPKFLDLCGKDHGILQGTPTWRGPMGRPGGAGSIRVSKFNYVAASFDNSWNSLTAVSIFLWAYHDQVVDASQTVLRVVDNEGGFDEFGIVRDNGSNTISASINKLGVGSHSAGTAMIDGWFHVGLTWQGGGNLKIYTNGILRATTDSSDISAFNIANRPAAMSLGRSADAWHGPTDDLRRYNRVLTDGEVWSLYQASLTGYQQELNYYRQAYIFDVGAGGGGATAMARHYYELAGGIGV